MMKMCLKTCGKVTHLVVHDDVCVACGRIGDDLDFGLGPRYYERVRPPC